MVFGVYEVFVVHFQILQPKRCTLTYRGELGRLQMRKSKRRQILILKRKILQLIHNVDELFKDNIQCVRKDNCLGVTIDETARRAKVDNRHRLFCVRAVSVYVRHNVVSNLFFKFCRKLVIDTFRVFFEFVYLFLRDV